MSYKESIWDKIKWKLFGETNIIYWWIYAPIILYLTGLGIIIYVLYHFISKYW